MTLFDTLVLQAISRRFHRHVDDALLDRCARECGCAPIGRMCFLDDDATAEIVLRCEIGDGTRLLDLGCGRGFLGRWLDAAGIGVRYAGVDRVEVALESARQHVRNGMMTLGDFRATDWQPEFDVVTAIEIAIDGSVGESIFDAAAAALRTGGMFALTLASLHGQNAGRLGTLLKSAKQRFDYADLVDWTQRVTPFAHRTYGWWLTAPWHPEIAEKCTREAKAALVAVERGLFNYAVLFARK